MADALTLSFSTQRNADYFKVWRFKHRLTGVPINLTSWAAKLNINSMAGLGGAPALSLNQTETGFGSVISLEDGADGRVGIKLKAGDIAALSGFATDRMAMAFNLLLTDPSGQTYVFARGPFFIEPGV